MVWSTRLGLWRSSRHHRSFAPTISTCGSCGYPPALAQKVHPVAPGFHQPDVCQRVILANGWNADFSKVDQLRVFPYDLGCQGKESP